MENILNMENIENMENMENVESKLGSFISNWGHNTATTKENILLHVEKEENEIWWKLWT